MCQNTNHPLNGVRGPGDGNSQKALILTGMSDSIGIDGVWTVILGVWTDGCGIGALSSRTGSGSRTKFGIDRFRDLLFGGVTGREAGIEGRCTSDSIRNTLATRNNENIETLKKTQT